MPGGRDMVSGAFSFPFHLASVLFGDDTPRAPGMAYYIAILSYSTFFVTFWLLQLLLCYFVWRLAYIKERVCVCVSLAKRDTPPACLTGWDIDRYSRGTYGPA